MQRVKQENLPIIQIHMSQMKEVKASEVSPSNNICLLVFDLIKKFYDLKVFFIKPIDEDLV